MKIFIIHHPEDSYVAEIIIAAMSRSFTSLQVESVTYNTLVLLPAGAVLINPTEQDSSLFNKLTSKKCKILILGKLSKSIAKELGLSLYPLPDEVKKWAQIDINFSEPFNVTPVALYYNKNHFLTQSSSPLNPRHLCRYDFTDEWNNLGYGRITLNGDIWSLCNIVHPEGAIPLAELRNNKNEYLCTYAAIIDMPSSSILWYNRQVGPVDSLEWNIIEKFFGDYRPDDLICFPYISEIPSGFRGAVTMRLDCDQAIASARPLFELYVNLGIPFSLAVLTGLNMRKDDKQLLKDVVRSGGALLSHSHSHLPDWGGDYRTAFSEAVKSKQWLEENIPEAKPVKYAVSPFHQNKIFAISALLDAGYKGFIGGIIHNDPEFLLGRAGRVPFIKGGNIISHSQQCMLHGDCFHRYNNSVDIYKQSFINHLNAEAIFGYLDHPFSMEYQYGWSSEDERIKAHEELIRFIQTHSDIWWCSENECMDFLLQRDSAQLYIEKENIIINYERNNKLPPLLIHWKGETFEK